MQSILVVEDQAEARKPLMKLLRLEGYDVAGVANADDALIAARRQKFDLVLLDLMLPGTDGLTLLQDFRNDPVLRHLVVVVLTGVSDQYSLQLARERGVTDYLLKAQFTPDELLHIIRRSVTPEPNKFPNDA